MVKGVWDIAHIDQREKVGYSIDMNTAGDNTESASHKDYLPNNQNHQVVTLPEEIGKIPWIQLLREELIKQAKNGEFKTSGGEPGYIYDFLTMRPEIKKEKEKWTLNWWDISIKNRQQKDWYRKAIQNLEKAYSGNGDPAWMGMICSKGSGAWESISYKWYRTIPLKGYSFLQYIPHLIKELQQEWNNKWAKIQLKIPRGMLGFMQHSDSIVIHSDQENIDIENILNEWSKRYHIDFEERHLWRATKSIDGMRAGDTEKTSFTHLIEKQIIEHGNNLLKGGYNIEAIVNTMIIWAIDLSRKMPIHEKK